MVGAESEGALHFGRCSEANMCKVARGGGGGLVTNIDFGLGSVFSISFSEVPYCCQLQSLLLVTHRWQADFVSEEQLVA